MVKRHTTYAGRVKAGDFKRVSTMRPKHTAAAEHGALEESAPHEFEVTKLTSPSRAETGVVGGVKHEHGDEFFRCRDGVPAATATVSSSSAGTAASAPRRRAPLSSGGDGFFQFAAASGRRRSPAVLTHNSHKRQELAR